MVCPVRNSLYVNLKLATVYLQCSTVILEWKVVPPLSEKKDTFSFGAVLLEVKAMVTVEMESLWRPRRFPG